MPRAKRAFSKDQNAAGRGTQSLLPGRRTDEYSDVDLALKEIKRTGLQDACFFTQWSAWSRFNSFRVLQNKTPGRITRAPCLE
jgi:hypothetical protein